MANTQRDAAVVVLSVNPSFEIYANRHKVVYAMEEVNDDAREVLTYLLSGSKNWVYFVPVIKEYDEKGFLV